MLNLTGFQQYNNYVTAIQPDFQHERLLPATRFFQNDYLRYFGRNCKKIGAGFIFGLVIMLMFFQVTK